MIEVFGVVIHEPDVALTDLALALECVVLARLIRRPESDASLGGLLVALFLALAASSLFGALFHAFFPAKTETTAGLLMWILVTAAIACVAAVVWLLDALFLRGPAAAGRARPAAALYGAGFVAVIAFVEQGYATVIALYAPPLLLLTGIAGVRLATHRSRGWGLVLLGLLLSFAAAGLQVLGIGLHPRWFDHNAVYHLVQGIALVVLFLGLRRLRGFDPAGSAPAGAPRNHPSPTEMHA